MCRSPASAFLQDVALSRRVAFPWVGARGVSRGDRQPDCPISDVPMFPFPCLTSSAASPAAIFLPQTHRLRSATGLRVACSAPYPPSPRSRRPLSRPCTCSSLLAACSVSLQPTPPRPCKHRAAGRCTRGYTRRTQGIRSGLWLCVEHERTSTHRQHSASEPSPITRIVGEQHIPRPTSAPSAGSRERCGRRSHSIHKPIRNNDCWTGGL